MRGCLVLWPMHARNPSAGCLAMGTSSVGLLDLGAGTGQSRHDSPLRSGVGPPHGRLCAVRKQRKGLARVCSCPYIGGLHQEKVPSESRFGPVQPEVRPSFSVSALLRTFAPQTAINGPKRAQTGVARCCGAPTACHACPIGRPRSVADPDRGPPSAVQGRFWPVGPGFAPVLPGYPPRLGGPGQGVGGAVRSRKQGFREATPKFKAGARARAGAAKNFLLWRAYCCLLLVLIMGREV